MDAFWNESAERREPRITITHGGSRFDFQGWMSDLKPRDPNKPYAKTGIIAPPVLASTAGASLLPLRDIASRFSMPDHFCYAPRDLVEPLDQGSCGSCWAVSLCHMLGDRVAVQSNGHIKALPSPTQLMECSDYLNGVATVGCDGNDPYIALKSIQDKPIYLNAKDQYPHPYDGHNTDSGSCALGDDPSTFGVSCKSACIITEPIQKPGDATNRRNVESIKRHIYFEGPVVATFKCLDEFADYDGLTIYEPPRGASLDGVGGHAIEIVGWGKEPHAGGASYWVCRNSWGQKWPQKHKTCAGIGFFYFKMGSNVCGIEEHVCAAMPVVRNPDKAPKHKDGAFPDAICTIEDLIDDGWEAATRHNGKIKLFGAIVAVVGVSAAVWYVVRKRKSKM